MKKYIAGIIFIAAIFAACDANDPTMTNGKSIPQRADELLNASPEKAIQSLINDGFKVYKWDYESYRQGLADSSWTVVNKVNKGDIDISDQWKRKLYHANDKKGQVEWTIQFGESAPKDNKSGDARTIDVSIIMDGSSVEENYQKALDSFEKWHKYNMRKRSNEFTYISGTIEQKIPQDDDKSKYESIYFTWSTDEYFFSSPSFFSNPEDMYENFIEKAKSMEIVESVVSAGVSYHGRMKNGDPISIGYSYHNYEIEYLNYGITNFDPLPQP